MIDMIDVNSCIVCRQAPQYTALFVIDTEHNKKYKVPDGKQRVVKYSVCEEHYLPHDQKHIAMIEGMILNSILEKCD